MAQNPYSKSDINGRCESPRKFRAAGERRDGRPCRRPCHFSCHPHNGASLTCSYFRSQTRTSCLYLHHSPASVRRNSRNLSLSRLTPVVHVLCSAAFTDAFPAPSRILTLRPRAVCDTARRVQQTHPTVSIHDEWYGIQSSGGAAGTTFAECALAASWLRSFASSPFGFRRGGVPKILPKGAQTAPPSTGGGSKYLKIW